MLTLAPPLCQVRQVWVERTCPTTAAEQVGSNLSSGEAIDGFTVQPEPSRDRSNCEPLSQQLVVFGVRSLGPLFQPAGDSNTAFSDIGISGDVVQAASPAF